MGILFWLQPIFEALRIAFALIAMGAGFVFVMVFFGRTLVTQEMMKNVRVVFFVFAFLAVAISPLVEIEKVYDNIAYWLAEQEAEQRVKERK